MIVLGLDTCLGACSVAVADGRTMLSEQSEPMMRGHQERLALMVQSTMREARRDFTHVERIAVTIGPGSFTGVRVGLAFAKGLALGLGRPGVGVGTLEALAASAHIDGRVAAVIDAGRGNLFLQLCEGSGRALTIAEILPLRCAISRIQGWREDGTLAIAGPAADLLGDAFGEETCVHLHAPSAAMVARLGGGDGVRELAPLYLRAPDAIRPE